MKLMTTSMTMITILTLVFLLTTKLSKKKKMNREKNTQFECGFNPISSPRNSFSIHFFLISLLFLIFDIEISLLLPMMISKMTVLKEWLTFSSISILILILGLIHEWNMGMLEWTD